MKATERTTRSKIAKHPVAAPAGKKTSRTPEKKGALWAQLATAVPTPRHRPAAQKRAMPAMMSDAGSTGTSYLPEVTDTDKEESALGTAWLGTARGPVRLWSG